MEKETGRIHVALQLPHPQGRGALLLGWGVGTATPFQRAVGGGGSIVETTARLA